MGWALTSAIVDFQGLKMPNFWVRYLQVMGRASCGCIILMGSICKSRKEQIWDAQFQWEASSRYRKCGMQMQNLRRKYPQIPERARCRCNCTYRQAEKHLQVQRKASRRYVVPKKSICNSEYQGIADTSVTRKVNPSSLYLFQSRYITKQEKDYAIQRIGVGLTDEAEQECIVFFLLGGRRELNSKWICLHHNLGWQLPTKTIW